jgi:hypothetical protein
MKMKSFKQFLAEKIDGLEPIDPDVGEMYAKGVEDEEIIKFISKNKTMTAEEAKEYYAKFVKSKGKR